MVVGINGQRDLVDGERAIGHGKVVIGGGESGKDRSDGVGAGIGIRGCRAGEGDGADGDIGDGFTVHKTCEGAGESREGAAIVGFALIGSGDGENGLVDGEGGIGTSGQVVVGGCERGNVLRDGVGAWHHTRRGGSGISDGAGGGRRRCVGTEQADKRTGEGREGGAGVELGDVVRIDGQRCLGGGERAVDNGKGVVCRGKSGDHRGDGAGTHVLGRGGSAGVSDGAADYGIGIAIEETRDGAGEGGVRAAGVGAGNVVRGDGEGGFIDGECAVDGSKVVVGGGQAGNIG